MQKKVKVNIGEFRKLSQKCEKLEKIIKLLQEYPFIEKIYSESDHIYGAGKIAAILNNSGHKVSDRLVARIMHENGMFSIRGGSKKCICKE